jgi:coenzyme F420-reducing hydrogenase delta subunit
MEMAGASKQGYDVRVLPIRLTCLGRISAGIIIKAFEQGALGVLLLGCPSGTCQYESGFAQAEDVVAQTKRFLELLGFSQERLRLGSIPAETDQSFVETVDTFLKELDNLEPVPENARAIPASSSP